MFIEESRSSFSALPPLERHAAQYVDMLRHYLVLIHIIGAKKNCLHCNETDRTDRHVHAARHSTFGVIVERDDQAMYGGRHAKDCLGGLVTNMGLAPNYSSQPLAPSYGLFTTDNTSKLPASMIGRRFLQIPRVLT
jgi:hypothetical protein